jgi:hypothetical protein
MAEFEAIDLEEAQLLDPAQERVGHLLDDEQDARRPGGSLSHRIETPERVGVLEAPGVGVHHTEQESVVGAEVQSDQHEGALAVETDEVDRGLAQEQTRVNDLQAWLDALYVLGDQPLQVANVFDFQLPERRSHHSLPWPFWWDPRTQKKQTGDQGLIRL